HALAHVVAIEFLFAVLVDRLEQAFAERAQVRAAVGGVLAIDERIKGFAEAAVGMGETELKRLFRVMQRRVNWFAAIGMQVLHNEIEQAVAGLKGLAVVDQLQAAVEVAVVAQALFDVLGAKRNFFEN